MTQYVITLICTNCGNVGGYNFPQRKRFYPYYPAYYDQDGELVDGEHWSRFGNPKTPEGAEPIFCTRCQIPMLVHAPVNFPPPQFEAINA